MKLDSLNKVARVNVGLLTLRISLPQCHSLKDKRSFIKPIISRVQRDFKISIAEIGFLDSWQDSLIACAMVSNDIKFNQTMLQKIVVFIEDVFPQVNIVDQQIEYF